MVNELVVMGVKGAPIDGYNGINGRVIQQYVDAITRITTKSNTYFTT